MVPGPRTSPDTLDEVEVDVPQAHLAPDEVIEALALVAAVEAATGQPPLSDQSRLALQHSAQGVDGSGLTMVAVRDERTLVGFAQVSPSSGGWTLDLVWAPHLAPPDTLVADLVRTALHEARRRDGGPGRLTWWRDGDSTGRLEADLGFELDRALLQMRRPLPVGQAVTIATRPFVPGVDEDAFLAVNNRAFADHHEQSGWTHDMVATREREPWFDAEGFRLHERGGRLAGFCWTKVHPADGHDVALGEIYVIAVDPDFAGQGLGKQLTLAGLDHLSQAGLTTAMLYVDADNVSAVAMYERLGFHVHSSTRAFTRPLSPAEPVEPHSSHTRKDHPSA